ncbi:exosome complex protein Rrp42 [Candidatus Thorarchaeota archaeon]|jgi:exosome complex component RRP42|nr:MAG: exosome complex protein Rrp42 [Candidatus Thorarchaeota archaeon]
MGDFTAETISHIDRDFIHDLLRKGERMDGRAFDEYRELKIEADVVPAKAEGSALVHLGDTSVVAGVKVLVGQPYPDTPDEGVTMVTAEMSPIASPLFELGPPREPAIELARVVDRGVRESETVDTKKLCIEKGKKVYMVFADVYPLEYDGNLIDASSIAVNTALLGAKYPEMKMEDDEVVETGKTLSLPIKNIAIEHTVAKIGEHLVIDPILKEEFVQDCRLTMAVGHDDNFTAMQKGGGIGPMSLDLIDKAMEMALAQAKPVREAINEVVKEIE